MKKLIMFLMVLMLCLGLSVTAKADPIASYDFNGSLADCSGNGYDGEENGTVAYDGSGAPPGGSALQLDGTNSVELPLGAANPFDGSADWSIAMWFKVSDGEGDVLISSARDDTPDNHSLAVFVNADGGLNLDFFYVSAYETEATGLDDGTWHHMALVFTAPDTFMWYIDGVANEEEGTMDDPLPTIPSIEEDTILIGDTLNEIYPFEDFGDSELIGSIAHVGIFDEALGAGDVGSAKDDGFPCYGPKNPLMVDPNDVTIYEDKDSPLGDDMGSIYISLKFPPVGQGAPGNPDGTPISLEIIVDPNGFLDPCSGEVGGAGPNPDLNLIGGAGPNGRVSFTRNAGNWADVEVIRFQVVDDLIAEYPTLDEAQSIGVWVVPTPYEPNLARPVAQKIVGVTVMDNDQPDIIFTKAPPLQVYEYKYCTYWYLGVCYGWTLYPETVAVSLQVPPVGGGLVKLTMGMDTMGINNPPTTDPVIWTDPNILVFSADGATYKGIPTRKFDNPFLITVLGADDEVLQAGGGSEGAQNYTVALAFHVVESGIGQPWDSRYGDYNAQDVWEDKIEKTFSISIEDNECGAYGTLDMDISNPYYLMDEVTLGGILGNDHRDPNDWVDGDGNPLPDCHVDMYDVLEIAWRWFNCSDPQNLKPGGPCESYIIP